LHLREYPDHQLRFLFSTSSSRELPDHEIATYVANLLVDFVDVDQLYRIRNGRGQRLEEVGDMLVESDPLYEGGSLEREREIRSTTAITHCSCRVCFRSTSQRCRIEGFGLTACSTT
jgi:hypothetical protein